MEKKRILDLLLISFLFIVIAYFASAAYTFNSTGSTVTARGGTNGSEIFDNSSLWTKGGEVEVINFTINFTGPDAITGANITVPTNGYNIRFWNVSMNATTTSAELNYTNWRFFNRTGSLLTMENTTAVHNFTHGQKVPLNIWINATAENGTEGVFAWTINISDNTTGTETTTFRTYVDGMAPRLYNINITDGTNTLIASSEQLNNTKYLLTGLNLTVYATLNDSTFDVNSSVMLIYNISGPATKPTGRVIMMNITNGVRGTPFLLSAIIPAGTANDTNFTNFLLVANDTFNQVYTTSGTFNYTIDGANPTVTVTPPSTTTIDTAASITYKCSSTDASPVTYLWTLTKPNSQTKTATTTSVTFTGADTEGAGTYKLTCKVTDDVGQAVTSSVYEFKANIKSSSSTAGGGGAGGAGAGPEVEIKVDHNLAKEADATVEIAKKEGQSVTISIDNKVSHTVKFKKVTSNSVTLVIESDPVEVTLSVGESKQLDLDGDGTNELEVMLESISSGAAKVVMKKVAQTAAEIAAPAPTAETTPTPTAETTPTPTTGGAAEEPTSLAWLWVLIIVVIVVAIVVVIMKKKNK